MANLKSSDQVERYYRNLHDEIVTKRHASPHWIRRYAHAQVLAGFVERIPAGAHVLDAGCGEGSLAILLAAKGARVTAIDLSSANVKTAREKSVARGLEIEFHVGSVSSLPFEDGEFDYVVSSHVLEHMSDPVEGARELKRVAKDTVLVAMPTCFSLGALMLLGGGNFWQPSLKNLASLPIGFARMLWELVRNTEGPNEGYDGQADLPHIWRFPWKMKRILQSAGLMVVDWEAGPLLVPILPSYFQSFQILQRWLDRHGKSKVGLKFLGYGTMAVCRVNKTLGT